VHPVRVAILGAGDAGVCLAGSIAATGHQVTLWNRSPQRLEPLAEPGGILLRRPGQGDRRVHLTVTPDLAAACAQVDVVLLTISSSAQGELLAAHWDALRRAAVVVLVPGHTGGVLAALHALDGLRCEGDAALAEMPLPFVARRVGEAYTVHIDKTSAPLAVAAPAADADGVRRLMRQIVPNVGVSDGLLHSMVANTTAVLQPALACANAAAIREGTLSRIYAEGMTPAAVELASDLDAERLALAAAVGADVPSLTEWFTHTYRVAGRNIGEAVANCAPFQAIPAPRKLSHRFATEHVRTGAVPLAQLARIAGTPHAHLDALAAELSSATGIDLVASGRSLSDMGLDEVYDATQLRTRIQTLTQGIASWT
jgi:opine dehydrogenase